MIKENKNKSRLKTKKKILVFGLMLIAVIGIGFFGLVGKARAESPDDKGICTTKFPDGTTGIYQNYKRSGCVDMKISATQTARSSFTAYSTSSPAPAQTTSTDAKYTKTETASDTNKSAFQDAVDKKECFSWDGGLSPGGCLVQFSYYLLYVIPAFVLGVVAYFFNILISITLSSTLLQSTFVSTAWIVVRDLSNMFFILILLYVAIKIILGFGGSDAKKMITKVIILALLINFSMFFTEVIIDSSNMIASVFYNKLSTGKKDPVTGNIVTAPYDSVTGEKDISGGLVSAFNPTSLLNKDFFDQAKITVVPGHAPIIEDEVPLGMMMGIILITGLILLFAAYALFISGLSFVGRVIELFVLIIFSPFAFMSFSIPLLGSVDYIGWDSWFKRLLKVSFMAPIFMFFLYFIFMLTNAGIFADSLKSGQGIIIALLRIAIPAMVILILLMKATEYAKKGSGALGEALIKGAKVIGGTALGIGLGGAAVLGRASVGRAGAAMANSKLAKKWEAKGWGGEYARRGLAAVGSGSFDARGVKIAGQTLSGATGMKLGEAQKGGFTERRKADIDKRMKRAQSLEVGEDDRLKQGLNQMEGGLQQVLNANIDKIRKYDKDIEDARQNFADAAPGEDKKDAAVKLATAKLAKKTFRETTATTVKDSSGKNISIADLEKTFIPAQKDKIAMENTARMRTYANTVEGTFGRIKNFAFSAGQSSHKGSKEAAHKIRMGVKIETKKS